MTGVLGVVARGSRHYLRVILPLLLLASLLEGFGAAMLLPILNLIEAGPGALPARLVGAFDLIGWRPTVAGLVGLLFGAMVLRAAAVFAARVSAVKAGLGYEAAVKTGLLGDLLRASWTVAQRTTSGTFTNVALVETVRVKEIFLYTADLLSAALAAVAFAAVAALLSPLGFVAAVAVGGATVAIYALLNARVRRLGHALTVANDAAQRALAEVLGGVRYLLATHTGGALRARFAAQVEAAAAAQGRYHVLHTLTRVANEPLALAALIATAAFLHAGGQGLGGIIVFLAVLFRLYTKLSYSLAMLQYLAHHLPAAAAVEGLRAELAEAREPNGTRTCARLAQGIRLSGVDFAHPGRPPLFRGLDLEIPAGRTVALVGESGAGKSTIVDLVTGLVTPDAGEVLVDGVPLGAFDRASYRARLALVPQEPILFNDSIAANIRLQRPDADDAAVQRAAAMAYAHEFIAALPQGYATVVGERGVMFSGGQKQRIALARSLLAEPDLLILDEATSALDQESEARIKAAIDSLKGRLTVLVIAHRLSTIENADAVYCIEGGRAVRVEAEGIAARTA